MKDLYSIIGVNKKASAAEIKRAYRTRAKKLHPDLNPGDAKVAEEFKEISAAYSILGDPKARARYDRGEIDENGNERGGFSGFQNARHAYQQAGQRGRGSERFADFNAEDLFSDIFSGMRQRRRGPIPERGADRIYEVTIDFLDAVNGTKKNISLENGKTLAVKIPKNVKEGQQIRLRGQGAPGSGGGPSGDALIEVRIRPHPYFRREGNDIHLDLPITLQEAVSGAQVRVPTIGGALNVTVPAGSNSGKTLRLRGRGVTESPTAVGDQYVRLIVTLPDIIDNDLAKAIADWAKTHDYSVRDHLK